MKIAASPKEPTCNADNYLCHIHLASMYQLGTEKPRRYQTSTNAGSIHGLIVQLVHAQTCEMEGT